MNYRYWQESFKLVLEVFCQEGQRTENFSFVLWTVSEINDERTDRRDDFIEELSPFAACSSRVVLDPKDKQWIIITEKDNHVVIHAMYAINY